MSNAAVTTGDVCIGLILSRKLQRDILPNHGGYYESTREQEDKFRFIAFLKTSSAVTLNDCLSEPYYPSSSLLEIDLSDGELI